MSDPFLLSGPGSSSAPSAVGIGPSEPAPPETEIPGDRPASESHPQALDGGRTDSTGAWTERAWWLLTGFLLIDWAVRLQGASVPFAWVGATVFFLGVFGLMSITAAAVYSPKRAVTQWELDYGWLILLVFLAAYLLFAFVELHNSPGFGTDEIAFNQYAAQLATHGLNPYTHSMAPSFPLYGVSPDGWTYHLNGAPVTNLSYPALSFELYMPFLLAGWSTELATAINMIAWGVAIVMLFVMLPRQLRPAALLLGTITTFISYSFGGVTDFLYIPFLILALYRWNRFVTDRTWRRYVGPVCLGLAMAIKQTPWIIAPFLLIAVGHEAWARLGRREGLRTAARYFVTVAIAFLVPNLPFVVASPGPWLRDIFTPLEASLVPAGQGPIGLTLFLHLGGGSLLAYTVMVMFVLIALIAVFTVTYPRLRPIIAITPSIVLFFSSRSFGSYLVATLPVLLIAVVSVEEGPLRRFGTALPSQGGKVPSRKPGLFAFSPLIQRSFIAGAVAGLGVLAILTYGSSAPLRMQVLSVRTTGSLDTIQDVSVKVTNTSSRTIRPAFTVDQNGGAVTTFWKELEGPAVLHAGQSASYFLAARNLTAQLPVTGYFAVVAYTQHPDTVSVSPTFLPDRDHVIITPDAVDSPIPVGEKVVLQVTLRDLFDRPIHRAGVPVYLGQIIYDQGGIENSDAAVNGTTPGTSPVASRTDSNGVATFNVVGTQVRSDPVYFQANLRNGPNGYPYGYSEIVSILFTQPLG